MTKEPTPKPRRKGMAMAEKLHIAVGIFRDTTPLSWMLTCISSQSTNTEWCLAQ
jgi:hypothetical protein